MLQNMKIAILGGSFDPPHKGHIAIANRLLKLNCFDEIWLMPCYQHPFNKNLSAPNMRLEMTRFLADKKIEVLDYEIKNKTTSYTIDTLEFFAKKYPKHKLSWIIGTDQVGDFPKWKNWQEIINNFKLIVVPRTDYTKAKKDLAKIAKQVTHPENVLFINRQTFPPIYISSRFVRQKIKEGKSIFNLVPKSVEKYIMQNKLYTISKLKCQNSKPQLKSKI